MSLRGIYKLRSPRGGFTLAELALVLGVIGTIIGGIWWGAANVRESARDNDAVSELNTIAQNVVSLMQNGEFRTAGNVTSTMITAGAVPQNYIDPASPTTIDHPWATSQFVVSVVTAVPSRQFRITLSKVSLQGCIALLTGGTNCESGQAMCPVDAIVAGTSVTPNATTGWPTVMTVNEVNTLCAGNSYTGGTNSVAFDYVL